MLRRVGFGGRRWTNQVTFEWRGWKEDIITLMVLEPKTLVDGIEAGIVRVLHIEIDEEASVLEARWA